MQKIREGKIKLYVPVGRPYEVAVFFNPEAELTRDISVAALAVWQRRSGESLNVCDALAGTGAMGLRYALEVAGVRSVMLNDRNPAAVRLIKKNIKLNMLQEKCTAAKLDANLLLSQRIWSVVDLDPFGPASPYLDSAARAVFWRGLLAISATDTAALCGTYPEACERKYGIRSLLTDYYKELGIRILVSATIRACARHEKAFNPLLTLAEKHYFRIFGEVGRGHVAVDKLLGQFGYVSHCFACGNRELKIELRCGCGSTMDIAGPVYLGELNNRNFCQLVLEELRKRNFELRERETRLLQLILAEPAMPFYYDLHILAKLHKRALPRHNVLINKLKKAGFRAGRTALCPTAIKTDANLEQLLKLLPTSP